MAFYNVIVLDHDKCEINRTDEVRNLPFAVQIAKDFMKDPDVLTAFPEKVIIVNADDPKETVLRDFFFETEEDL